MPYFESLLYFELETQHFKANYVGNNVSIENASAIRKKIEETFNFEHTQHAYENLMELNLSEVNCATQASETSSLCNELEFNTSNGQILKEKNLQNHLVECENDLETVSFKLNPNDGGDEQVDDLKEFLTNLANKVDAVDTRLKPLIFSSGSHDQMENNWYHLHRF